MSKSFGCLNLSDAASKVSLSRTHFDTNKFRKAIEEDFETVSDVIKGMIRAFSQLMLTWSQCSYALQ